MYIIFDQGKFTISSSAENAVAEIMPPLYLYEAGEHSLSWIGDGLYRDGRCEVKLTVRRESDTLFYIHRTWENISAEPLRFQTVFRIRPCYAPERYLIPCVNVNGNVFGNGGEPKGLERDGRNWIFAYDREALPACTLTENREFACGLFASAESDESIMSSCSIRKDGDTWYQEILHPVMEAPLTYCNRDQYSPEYQTYITLEHEEVFESGMYLSVSRPRWESYGVCDMLDSALEVFGDNSDLTVPGKRHIWNWSIQFAKSLISDYDGKKGFIIGFLPDGNGGNKFLIFSNSC